MDAHKGKIIATGVVKDKNGKVKQHFTLTSDPEAHDDSRSTENVKSEEKGNGSNTPRHNA